MTRAASFEGSKYSAQTIDAGHEADVVEAIGLGPRVEVVTLGGGKVQVRSCGADSATKELVRMQRLVARE